MNSTVFSFRLIAWVVSVALLIPMGSAIASKNRQQQPQVSQPVYNNPTKSGSPSQSTGSYGSSSRGPSASGTWSSKPGFGSGSSGSGAGSGYQVPWKNKAGNGSVGGTGGSLSSGSARPVDRKFLSNGIAVLNKEPTPAEKLRGFTGKVTQDGRAIVKVQDRFYSLPETRAGATSRSTQTSQAALATRWSPQQQASINSDIQKLAGISPNGVAGGGAGKSEITRISNTVATQNRIAEAGHIREFGGNASDAIKLQRKLASQSQMKESGIVIAGEVGKPVFIDAPRVAKIHGGRPADWLKKSSSSYEDKDGDKWETHWVENKKTGRRVEFKTIINGKKGLFNTLGNSQGG